MHRFLPARASETYDALLVICGCRAQCADTSEINVRKGKLIVTEELYLDEIEAFFDRLEDA